MGKNFMDGWVKKPTSGAGGVYFRDGRGTLIVKNVGVYEKRDDHHTYILELYVKDSIATEPDGWGSTPPGPNPAGSSVTYLQQLESFDSAQGNAKAANIAILGPDAAALDDGTEENLAKLGAEFAELMNLDENALTKKGTVSLARGMELVYETRRQTSKKGTKMVIPSFRHVPLSPKEVVANRKLLGDADAAAEKAA